MAMLRDTSGGTFVTYGGINARIAPASVAQFVIPSDVSALARNLPPAPEQSRAILAACEKALGRHWRAEELIFTRVICVSGGGSAGADTYGRRLTLFPEMPPDVLSEEFQRSMRPHHTRATELHHIVAGGMLMGLELHDGEQAIVYLGPGETLRLVPAVQHWPYDPADGPHLVVSCFDARPPERDGRIVADIDKIFTGLQVQIK